MSKKELQRHSLCSAIGRSDWIKWENIGPSEHSHWRPLTLFLQSPSILFAIKIGTISGGSGVKTPAKTRGRDAMVKARRMNAVEMLKADHRKVEDLFEKYEKSRSKKADIAKTICLELIVHTMLEEEIFYQACREAGVEDDMMNEAAVEHDGAKVLIAELEHGSPDDDYYDAKVKVLSEEIKHHVKEEEKRDGVFAQAKSKGLDLDALGEQMATRKEEILSEIDEDSLPTPVTVTMKADALQRGEASA